jgi:hypothetical protein
MNCPECEALILEAADCGSNSATVRAHLTECASCQAFFEVQQTIHGLLCGGLSEVHLSREFEARLRRRIHVDRSLAWVRRAIASLEFTSYLLLAGAVVFLSALVMRLPWPELPFYFPAIVVGIALTIVREFVSGEIASD